MHNRLFLTARFSLLIATVTLFSLLSASPSYAATINLPATGQTLCYADGYPTPCAGTGQDGDKQLGVTWPSPRFTDNGNQTITDNLTSLVWVSDPNLMKTRDPAFDTDCVSYDGSGNGNGYVTWQRALGYVAKLNTDQYQGFSDWRLPNVKELESFIYLHATYPPITNFSLSHWSSTTVAQDSTKAWVVYVDATYNGEAKADQIRCWQVWPVRGQAEPTTPAAIPQTGQTTSYAVGDDGALRAGVAWPTPRFTDNGDGTVTDKLTGLIWLQYANCFGNITWPNALANANTLASGACGLADGSTAGQWRLPNFREMQSLLDYQQYNPAVPLDSPFLFSDPQAVYWSSTIYRALGNLNRDYSDIFSVKLGSGERKTGIDSDTKTLWPVRGGQMKLTATLAGTGSGAITATPGSLSCSTGSCNYWYDQGTMVTLTATPNSGSLFMGWSGVCTGTAGCTVTVDAAKTVTATFDQAAKLTVGIFGKGTVTSNPTGISCSTGNCFAYFPKNSSVILYHTEAYGYTFSAWTSTCPGTGDCTVNLTGNLYIPATFSPQDNVRRNLLATPYGTLTSAYEVAVTGDVLKAKTMTFLESLSLGRDINVMLQGGFGSDFGTPNDFTSVRGGVTISAGSVTLDRIIIK